MGKQIWLQDGDIFSQGSATTVSHPEGLPKGIYEVKVSMTGFYLSKIAESFTFDYKLYGLNQKFIDYVLKTYENTTGNLGVLLDGIKGTGKTVVAKELCNRLQLPVILVQSMGSDTNSKLIKYLSTSIDFDCIFFFDEYEKEFKNSSDVLSFMDGTYNSIYRKVFLLTTNELNVDPNLLGRPSRIRYKKSFNNLSEEVTREILNDILEDKTAIEKVIELTHSMNIITIDLIKAIATEINIHGVKALPDIKETFNIEFSRFTYLYREVQIRHCDLKFTPENIKNILKAFYKFKEIIKKDWEKYTNEERKFYNEWSTKFSEDYGSTTEDKELKYLEPGDYFEDERILMVSIKEKYVVTMTDYGNIRIYIINSCYSTSKATGLVNYEL
nr:MAG: dnaA protein [Bacteriophage sp.]